jgi:rare lipoprotein A
MRLLVVLLIGLVAAIPHAQAACVDSEEVGRGIASWYGPGFEGNLTSDETPFDPYAFTAAHPSLPFGTRVKVMNLRTSQSVMVTINDRGGFAKTRVIDLSKAAAREIGMMQSGLAPVALYACR